MNNIGKHVLYIGQAIDPLDEYDLSDRKKIGVTLNKSQLPVRESQLRRDAGTIMPFSYIVLAAWKFNNPVAEEMETLLHGIRSPYQGEWIKDAEGTLIDAVRDMLAAFNIDSKHFANVELDLSSSPDADMVTKIKGVSLKWPLMERMLYDKCGEMHFTVDNNHAYANGTLEANGYCINNTNNVYDSLAQACRAEGPHHGYKHGYAACYRAFKTKDGISFEQHLKNHNIL